MEIVKIKIYIAIKTTFEIFSNNKLTLFDLKDFISYKHICKIYILADIEERRKSRFI